MQAAQFFPHGMRAGWVAAPARQPSAPRVPMVRLPRNGGAGPMTETGLS
jgi:hypothetical protein